MHIPDLITIHVPHGNMTDEDMLAAHNLFLTKDWWLTPGLTAEIHRHHPKNKDIKERCLQLFPAVKRVFDKLSKLEERPGRRRE
jgi:hypothetical protein